VMTDLLSGQVQLYFGTTASSLEYARTGKLRALAVAIERRLDALPEIPTVAEFVPGYEASNWYGVGAPKATPAEIIHKLNKEISAALADPKIEARLADLGGIALTGSPSDFGKLIVEETEKWGKVVKFVGIKADWGGEGADIPSLLRDGNLVGIISIGDVVKHRLEDLEYETNVLRDAYMATHWTPGDCGTAEYSDLKSILTFQILSLNRPR
jgi:CBS domain-containing protein